MEKQKEVDELRLKIEQPLEPNDEVEDTEVEEDVDEIDTENEE